jgi:citrate lyase subunit beta/citryl-CoA lyase
MFVPGDRPDQMQKAMHAGADALILDLEDSVAPSRKPEARLHVAHFLERRTRNVTVLVRINPLPLDAAAEDLQSLSSVVWMDTFCRSPQAAPRSKNCSCA